MFVDANEVEARIADLFKKKYPALESCVANHQQTIIDWQKRARDAQADIGLEYDPAEPASSAPTEEGRRDDLILIDLIRIVRRDEVKAALTKYILDPLGVPHLLTVGEVWELADRTLFFSGRPVRLAVESFRTAIAERVNRFTWSRAELVGYDLTHSWSRESAIVIWQNDWVQIALESRPIRVPTLLRFYGLKAASQGRVYATITGWISDEAGRRLSSEMRRVVRAALWCAVDLTGGAMNVDGIFLESRPLPMVSKECIDAASSFISQFIGAYWLPRRCAYTNAGIRNAVQLIVEAGVQRNDSIAIALYCSAMEALLGTGRGGVTQALSENVATLLEDDPRERPSAAAFVCDIYDKRSRAAHGDSLDGNSTVRSQARALSTHVLQAVLERRLFDEKLGVKPKSSDQDSLLNELRSARLTGQQIVGVSQSLRARELWRTTTK